MSQALAQSRPALRALNPAAVIALCGAALYALLLLQSTRMGLAPFGYEFYDQVWLALLEGRLDLPARVLRLEGHYTPDGTAYFYHGLAPLVTRALLDPFLQIGQVSLSPFSIWLWAVIGTTLYQMAFLRVLPQEAMRLRIALSVLVWFGGPGVLLAGNHAFYHEPIALAYALGGGFVLIWVAAIQTGRMSARALVGLALLAALCVHARPNLAAALFVGVGFAALWALWQARLRLALPVLLAALLLGAGGYSYMALNAARFGDSGVTHGSFEKSDVRYGSVFWGIESETSIRALGFIEHGRFNIGRVIPNALAYTLMPPPQMLTEAHNRARIYHFAMSFERTGFTRIEMPVTGMALLWAGWLALAMIGLAGLRKASRAEQALAATAAVSAVLIFAYATITLRYMLAIWPLVAVLSLVSLPRLAQRVDAVSPVRAGAFALAAGLGIGVSLHTASIYRFEFRENPATAFKAWDAETCKSYVMKANLPESRRAELCRAPRVES